MMTKVDGFLDSLVNYDKEHIHPDVVKAIQPYLQDPEFDPKLIAGKSLAAAGKKNSSYNVYNKIFAKRLIHIYILYYTITIYQ